MDLDHQPQRFARFSRHPEGRRNGARISSTQPTNHPFNCGLMMVVSLLQPFMVAVLGKNGQEKLYDASPIARRDCLFRPPAL
jgi:hypothetical protein